MSLRSLGFADRLLMPRLMSSRFAERAAAGPSRMGVGAPTAVYPFPWFADELAKIETARMMLGHRPTLARATAPTQYMAPQAAPIEALAWVDLGGYQSAPQVQTVAPRAFPQAMPNVMMPAPVAAPVGTPQAQLAALTQARAAFEQQRQAPTQSAGLSVAMPAQPGFALRSEWDPAPLATAILAASASGGTVFAPFASPLLVHSAIGMALAAGASVEGAGAGAEARMSAPAQRGASQPRTMLAVSDSMLRAEPASARQAVASPAQARAVQAQLATAQRAHEATVQAQALAITTTPTTTTTASASTTAPEAVEYAQMFAPAGLVAGLAPSMVDLASALVPPAAMPAATVASALTSAAAPGGFALPVRQAMASRAPSLAPVFQAAYAMPAFVPAQAAAGAPPSMLAAGAPSLTMPLALAQPQQSRTESFVQSLTRILARQDAGSAPALAQPGEAARPAFADVAARFVPAFINVGPDGAPEQTRAMPATRPVATPSLGAQLAPLASLLSMSPAAMAAAPMSTLAVATPPEARTLDQAAASPLMAPSLAPAAAQLRSQIFAPITQPDTFMPAFVAPTFSAPVFSAPTFAPAAAIAPVAPTGASTESRLGRMTWTAELATSLSAMLPASAAQAPFAALALPLAAPSFARSIGHTDWVDAQMARRSPQPEVRGGELRLAGSAPAQTLVTALDAPMAATAATMMRSATPAALAARDASSVLAGGLPVTSPMPMMASATMPQVMFDAGLAAALPMPVLSMAALSAGAPVTTFEAAPHAPLAASFAPTATGFSPSLAASPVPAASAGGHAPAWAMSELIASLAGVAALRDTLPSSVLEHSMWVEPTMAAPQARVQTDTLPLAARAPSRVALAVADEVAPSVQAQVQAQAQSRARAETVQVQRAEQAQAQLQVRQAHAEAMARAHADVALEVERATRHERVAPAVTSATPGQPALAATDTVRPTTPWTQPLATSLESSRPGAMAARFEAMANRTVARSADLALDIVDPALLAEGRALGLSPLESVAALRLAAGGPAALRGPDFSMTFLNVAPDGAESPGQGPAWRAPSRSTTVVLAERAAQVPMGVPASFLPGLAPGAQVPQAAVFAAQAGGGPVDFQYLAGGQADEAQGDLSELAPRQAPAMTMLRGSTTWPRSVEASRSQAFGATANLASADGPASTWLHFTATLASQVSGASELMAQLASAGVAPERAAVMAMTLAQSAPGRVPLVASDNLQPQSGPGPGPGSDELGLASEQLELAALEASGPTTTAQGRAVAQLEQARAQLAVFGMPSAADSTRASSFARAHSGARRAATAAYQTWIEAPRSETLQLSTGAIGHSAPAPSRPSLAASAPPMPEPVTSGGAPQSALSREEVVRAVSTAVGGSLPSWLADAAAKQAATSPVDQFTALDLAFVQTAAPRAIPLAAKGAHEPSPPPGRGHPSGASNKKKGGGEDLETLARQIYDEILRMMDLQRERTGGS
ncbi:MAG: hypothetical protein IT370_00690 [Deltaproteobacteria bacterium]|nr:hypothetical protein [Deltaproteobacteria bacterium]